MWGLSHYDCALLGTAFFLTLWYGKKSKKENRGERAQKNKNKIIIKNKKRKQFLLF